MAKRQATQRKHFAHYYYQKTNLEVILNVILRNSN